MATGFQKGVSFLKLVKISQGRYVASVFKF